MIGIADLVAEDDQSPEDSSALFGGDIEEGYITGGYLVAENFEGQYNYCGITNVARGVAITAAHCIEDIQSIVIGFGGFTFEGENNLEPRTISRDSLWRDGIVERDFAVIEYDLENESPRPNAQLVDPEIGCDYRVVAYGRTENETESVLGQRPRKSAQVCITSITDQTIIIESDEGGICMGDSGSPIYREGTDQLVGIVSSILAARDSSEPCFIGNRAVAVRAKSSYETFLAQDFGTSSTQFTETDIQQASDLFENFRDSVGISTGDLETTLFAAAGGLFLLSIFSAGISQIKRIK